MASRKLLSMGFDRSTLDQLTKKGFITSESVLGRPLIDVLNDLDVPLPTLQDIVRVVSVKIAPQPKTARQLLLARQESTCGRPLSTLLQLDEYLLGGLHPGSLTEIIGPASVGKTQFCHMLAVSAAFPRRDFVVGSNSVLYFDTEKAFSSLRLSEMAASYHRQFAPTNNQSNSDRFRESEQLDMQAEIGAAGVSHQPPPLGAVSLSSELEASVMELINRVTVFDIATTSQLMERLQTLEDEIIEKNVRLIVIDSLSVLVRRDFSSELLPERANFFNKLASLLKYYAAEFDLAVVVVNQSAKQAGGGGVAGLGKVWSHCVNTRLVLDCVSDSEMTQICRAFKSEHDSAASSVALKMRLASSHVAPFKKLTIAKSPISPVLTLFYSINISGLVLLNRREFNLKLNQHESNANSAAISNSNTNVTVTESWPRPIDNSSAISNAMEVEENRPSERDGTNLFEKQAGMDFNENYIDGKDNSDGLLTGEDLSILMEVQEFNFWEDYFTGQNLGPSAHQHQQHESLLAREFK